MRLAAILLLIASSAVVQAASCGTPGGANVFNQKDDSGFVMHLYLESRDVQFAFPGKKFTREDSAPGGKFAFLVDGIFFQVLTTPITPFLGADKRPDDPTLLDRHAAWEVEHAGMMPTPLRAFTDLGTQALDGRGLHMKVWRLSDKEPSISQYFVTTVLDDDVVSLSAVVRSDQESGFRTFLSDYSGSFNFLGPCESAD